MSACLFVFFFCVYLFIYFNYSNKLNVALKMLCDKLVKIVVAVVESAHKVFTVLFPCKQNPVNTCFKRLRRLYMTVTDGGHFLPAMLTLPRMMEGRDGSVGWNSLGSD